MLCSQMQLCFVEHPKELTEEEKQQIVQSEDFLTFFDRSIRLVERTLAEDLDIFFDYSGRDMEDREGSGHFSLEQRFNQCTLDMRHIHILYIKMIILVVFILTGLLILKRKTRY